MADPISLWKPEPNVVLHQALGKLLEELGELTQIASRCMIQGFDASEPVTGVPNRQQLQKEMSDVYAALEWVSDITDVAEDTDRVMTKLDGYHRWQRMLEASARAERADMLRKVESVLNIPSAGHASAGELADTILDALGFVEGRANG